MSRIIKRIFVVATAFVVASNLNASVPRTPQQRLVESLNASEPFASAVWGVLATTMDGDTIAVLNHRQKMVPASNMKLITTGCALKALGSDYRFSTHIACNGTVKDGVLDGDVFIIGGGDPTTAATDSCSEAIESTFARWKSFLDAAGIREIRGKIIGDGSALDGEMINTDWSCDDSGTDYGIGPCGLNFFENAQHFNVVAGDAPGDRVHVWVDYPKVPWMKFEHDCVTSPAGNGDELYYVSSPLSHHASMRGRFAVDRAAKTLGCSNFFPALTCAYYFHSYLTEQGIKIGGGYSDGSATDLGSMRILGKSESAPIAEIVRKTNYESDNFYAETFIRTLGVQMHSSACYDSSRVALRDVIESLGLDSKMLQIRDGSGLSRKNYVSPDFFVRYLKAMAGTPVFECFLHSLPQAGKGTLKYRLQNQDPELRARVFMKSGSMNGVRCYSGYILPSGAEKTSKTIVFSVMTNNVTASTAEVNRILDRVIGSLASANK